ncbi:MAG: CoA transferase [Candidatus Tectomicrobia bacterium]|nr:CoA transferase [Candidatus Tectomicrobia bacterium]
MQEEKGKALSGWRLLDMTDSLGFYCVKLLADMGADVIKIERPGGDSARLIGPFESDLPHPEKSLSFLYFNANKRGITLNIETPEGQEIFKALIKKTDIFVETFNPGYLPNLNLGYETLSLLNPSLIMTSISGFGQSGPYSQYEASDIVGFAMGGLMALSGEPDGPPCVAPDNQAYIMAGAHAAASTLAALFYRQMTGKGQYIDASMLEAMTQVIDCGITRYSVTKEMTKRFRLPTDVSPEGNYPCKDGYVRISIFTQRNWRNLLEWIGDPPELLDPKWEEGSNRRGQRDIIDPPISAFTMNYTKAELYEIGQKMRVPITPVNTPEEFMNDPHTIAREFFVQVNHPVAGTIKYPGAPFRLSGTPWSIECPAPLVGQHNEEIYRGELGMSEAELAQLREKEII